MTISEKTLRKWRREALEVKPKELPELYKGTAEALAVAYEESCERILRLTQELLDQALLRKGGPK